MHDLKEKSAYLRGLVEGAGYPENEKQKMIWEGLLDFCDDVAKNIDELDGSQTEFAEYIEAIDEDLSALEKYFYNTGEDDEDTDILFSKEPGESFREINCPHCGEAIGFEDGDYEVICPECGKTVTTHVMAPKMNQETTAHS